QSIFRRGETTPEQVRQQPWQVTLNEPAERALAMKLLRFPEAVADVGVDYRPNFMTAYLYELAKTFSTFFQQCPVLKSEEPLKTGRLQLCDMTARTLRKGLELLGIGVVGKM
ncbi:MAG: DALR anticodon-binding domain-containing protein, partial [bacterium]|nr:DALR anticodon-binding domain-containing protein [bacterium]